jgi:hypothetical protein
LFNANGNSHKNISIKSKLKKPSNFINIKKINPKINE